MSKKMEEVLKEFETLRSNYLKRIRLIQDDPDLLSSEKKTHIKKLVEESREKRFDLLKKLEATRSSEKERLEKEIFTSSDQGYHAALYQVAGLKDENEVLSQIERAVRAGDNVGVLAAGHIAFERGYTKALERFAAENKNRGKTLQELEDFSRQYGDNRNNAVKFSEKIATSGIQMPVEL